MTVFLRCQNHIAVLKKQKKNTIFHPHYWDELFDSKMNSKPTSNIIMTLYLLHLSLIFVTYIYIYMYTSIGQYWAILHVTTACFTPSQDGLLRLVTADASPATVHGATSHHGNLSKTSKANSCRRFSNKTGCSLLCKTGKLYLEVPTKTGCLNICVSLKLLY